MRAACKSKVRARMSLLVLPGEKQTRNMQTAMLDNEHLRCFTRVNYSVKVGNFGFNWAQ